MPLSVFQNDFLLLHPLPFQKPPLNRHIPFKAEQTLNFIEINSVINYQTDNLL